ncbi:hypothetical protein NPIL_183751 [Nephila pilipes]|uniref:Uncharacterized protein n=1 Tax=Nephila pilipes TaxID=299642 RepID=A0A8X6PGP7_NEPPI|nr:hypothetical protein NPIL_183751 [Nephila pilipes]
MKGIWKKCVKRFANYIESLDNLEQTDVIHAIVGFINALHLDTQVEDITELGDYTNGELTNEDLINLEELQHLEEKEEKKNHLKISTLESTTSVTLSSSLLPGPSTAPDNQINQL